MIRPRDQIRARIECGSWRTAFLPSLQNCLRQSFREVFRGIPVMFRPFRDRKPDGARAGPRKPRQTVSSALFEQWNVDALPRTTNTLGPRRIIGNECGTENGFDNCRWLRGLERLRYTTISIILSTERAAADHGITRKRDPRRTPLSRPFSFFPFLHSLIDRRRLQGASRAATFRDPSDRAGPA